VVPSSCSVNRKPPSPAIEFEGVNARNPEHRIDPVRLQQRDRRVAPSVIANLVGPHAIFLIELPA